VKASRSALQVCTALIANPLWQAPTSSHPGDVVAPSYPVLAPRRTARSGQGPQPQLPLRHRDTPCRGIKRTDRYPGRHRPHRYRL